MEKTLAVSIAIVIIAQNFPLKLLRTKLPQKYKLWTNGLKPKEESVIMQVRMNICVSVGQELTDFDFSGDIEY